MNWNQQIPSLEVQGSFSSLVIEGVNPVLTIEGEGKEVTLVSPTSDSSTRHRVTIERLEGGE